MEPTFEAELTQFLIDTFGNECWDDSAQDTAVRWMKAMREFAPVDDLDFKETVFLTSVAQMVVVKKIQFTSICAHHLFPFMGSASVGYIPNGKMIGVSKIPRIVHYHAHKPNTQETLAHDIASHLKSLTGAQGVAVVMQGVHTCMACRGVRETQAEMITSEMRGVFLSSGDARQEFLNLIQQEK